MAVKLYVIPGSHPSKAAELMLEHKGIPFKRVDLVTAMHRPSLKLLGFKGKTVPAMKADGRKFQGTREISRALDEIKPNPSLLTSGAVIEAERWGDAELQPIPRRLAWWALLHLSGEEAHRAARRVARRATAWACRSESPPAPCCRSPRWRLATTTRPTDQVRLTSRRFPSKIDRVDALTSRRA